jgi:hypothetical protein
VGLLQVRQDIGASEAIVAMALRKAFMVFLLFFQLFSIWNAR